MKYREFTVSSDDDGRRLDKILLKLFPSLSSSFIQKNIRNGFVRLNGVKTSSDTRVHLDDIISCGGIMSQQETKTDFNINKEQESSTNIGLKIPVIFRNKDIIVFNKPYDLKVQSSSAGDFSLDSYTKANYPPQESLSFKTGPLHRLDRKTTGLVIFSQSLYGAQTVTDAITSRQIKKIYLAIIQGHPTEIDEWHDCLESNDTESESFKTMRVVDKKSDFTKQAITVMKPLSYGTYSTTGITGAVGMPVTLAQFEIITGRKHQIRLQSSSHGYPLLGDTAYNGLKINESQDFYLHAFSLEFLQPIGDAPKVFQAPLNENFCSMVQKCLMNNDLRIII